MTDTLREKVALAIINASRIRRGFGAWPSGTTLADITDGSNTLVAADAAIATVLEALQTPTEAMCWAGAEAIVEDKPTTVVWQSMLTAYIEGSAK